VQAVASRFILGEGSLSVSVLRWAGVSGCR